MRYGMDYDSTNKKREIDLLLEQLELDELMGLAQTWASESPESRKLINAKCSGAPGVTAVSVVSRYATNIETIGDILRFDATADCVFEVTLSKDSNSKSMYVFNEHSSARTRFTYRLTFRCAIAFDGTDGVFPGVFVYPGDARRDNNIKFPADKDFVPMIGKVGLDAEATMFLNAFCPEALTTPMRVPIGDIIVGKLGLLIMNDTIAVDGAVSDGSPTFGQIFFADGPVEFVCPQSGEVMRRIAPMGTILLDDAVTHTDNEGCLNYTLAHEAFHWVRHRVYGTMRNALHGEKFIACRKSPRLRVVNGSWTNGERLEWHPQAIFA